MSTSSSVDARGKVNTHLVEIGDLWQLNGAVAPKILGAALLTIV